MGMFVPEKGEIHRFVLELKGKKTLTKKEYEAYKAAIAKVVGKYGARIVGGEYLVVKKKPAGKGGK